MRNVTPEQVAMAEQHRRGELPDRIEGALGELAGAAKAGPVTAGDCDEKASDDAGRPEEDDGSGCLPE